MVLKCIVENYFADYKFRSSDYDWPLILSPEHAVVLAVSSSSGGVPISFCPLFPIVVIFIPWCCVFKDFKS